MPAQGSDLLLIERSGSPYKATAQEVADLGSGGGGSNPYAFRKRSSTSTGNASPSLVIPWDVDEDSFGSDVEWDVANPTRLSVASAGVYRIGGVITHSSNTQRGQASTRISINGTTQGVFRGASYVRNSGSSWDFWPIEFAPEPFNLAANDYFEVELARTSGAGANYSTGATGTIALRGVSSRVWVERVA